MNEVTLVAGFQFCIRCFQPDTKTVFGSRGDAEWHVAVLEGLGIPADKAKELVAAYCQQVKRTEPGKVPDGRFICVFWLCPDCATKLDVEVAKAWSEVHVYAQPEGA